MDIVLQIWGGGFYLLNKLFFALAEGKNKECKRRLRIVAWAFYLLGVPAWVIILVGKHDWIAASVEAGGIPAMLFGLYNVCRVSETPNRLFDMFATFFTYAALIFGVAFSLHDYGGLTTGTQTLEIGVMVGFLIGSYLLAKQNMYGWVFFMLMNVSMATLMLVQQKPILSVQQIVSLSFVIYGFVIAYKTAKRRQC